MDKLISLELGDKTHGQRVKETWITIFNVYKDVYSLNPSNLKDLLDLYEELKYFFFKMKDRVQIECYIGITSTGLDIVDDDDWKDTHERRDNEYYIGLLISEDYGVDIDLDNIYE